MEPLNNRFGGGVTATVLHPAVAAAVALAIVLIFILPRKRIIVPILFIGFLVPLGQVLVVGGIHFIVLRIIVLVSCVRVLTMPSTEESKLARGHNAIDKAFYLWAFFSGTVYMLLYMEKDAIVNHAAFLVDAFCGYFVLRFLIRDDEDIRQALKVLAFIAMVIALSMINEELTGHNAFGLLGGVRYLSDLRDGRVRSQGAFQHPLLAGAFASGLLPLFFGLWKSSRSRLTALVGLLSCLTIVATTWTSTAFLSCAAGLLALCLWPIRKSMRMIRWGIGLTLLGLHMIMKAPVWALIGRMTVLDASSGDHRYRLVDNFIRRFGEWWLIGTKDYANWGWDMWDISNWYVSQGVGGGLITFVCFLAIIVLCFNRIGTARKAAEGDRTREWYFWSLGAALFAHTVAFFGTGYWDQMQFGWFIFVAMVSAVTSGVVPAPATDGERVKIGSVVTPKITPAIARAYSRGSSLPSRTRG